MFGVFLKHFGNELFSDWGDRYVIGKGVVAHFNFTVGGFDVAGLEGRSTHHAGVGYDS
jgi:hypothetical protein